MEGFAPQEWRVTGGTAVLEGYDHESWLALQEDLLETLQSFDRAAGVAGWGRVGALGAVFNVEAPTFALAAEVGASVFEDALAKIGSPVPPVRLEVEPAEYDAQDLPELERRIRTETGPVQALTAGEVAKLIGVARQRIYQLADREDFPRPIKETSRGAVWSREDIERFVRGWERRPGRPPAGRDLVDQVQRFDLQLTDRERLILESMAKATSSTEVADEIGLTVDAVRSAIRRVRQKLQEQAPSAARSS